MKPPDKLTPVGPTATVTTKPEATEPPEDPATLTLHELAATSPVPRDALERRLPLAETTRRQGTARLGRCCPYLAKRLLAAGRFVGRHKMRPETIASAPTPR